MGHPGRKQEGNSEFAILIENLKPHVQVENNSLLWEKKILERDTIEKMAWNIDLLPGTTAVNRGPEYFDALHDKNLHLTDLPGITV